MNAKTASKKALSLLLSVIMIFSVVSVGFVVGAECEHPNLTEDGWTIVRATTCQMEGKKTQWCNDCGTEVEKAIPIDKNAHVPGLWEVVREPDCKTDGLEALYCTAGCEVTGPIKTRPIPAHDFKVLYGEKANCMVKGYEFSYCTRCLTMKTEETPIKEDAHRFSDWTITKVATCAEEGVRERVCLNYDENGVQCEASETESYTDYDNHTNIVELPETRVEPTCTAPGKILTVCEGCNAEIWEEIPQHSTSHNYVIEEVKSTCHTNGYEIRKCECGMEFKVELELDPTAHVYGDWKVKEEPSCVDGLRYRNCEYHDATQEQPIPKTGEHIYGEWVTVIVPDCSSTGLREKVCTKCGEARISEELPTHHNYTTWTVEREMICDESNMTHGLEHAKCNDCNFEKDFVIPSNHSFGSWVIEERTDCKNINTPGTMKRSCSVCGKTETKEYYAEHDFTMWYTVEAPTCAKDGLSGNEGYSRRWCKTCSYTEAKSIPVTHEFTDWKIVKYPTCSVSAVESGLRTGTCKHCGKIKEESFGGAHNFGEWVVDTSKCEKTHVCLACGYEETTDAHDYVYIMGTNKCSADGKATLRKVCSVCNDQKIEENVSLNHPNLKSTTVAPTCVQNGYTYHECPDCDYKERILTDAYGHDFDENWTICVEATCSSPGSRYRACSRCDYLDFVVVDKIKHMLVTIEPGIEPTCTESGRSPKSYCAVCKEVFESVEIPAKGHTFPENGEICSVCKVYKESDNCVCSCHSTSGMESIIFMILNKIYQAFGINQECKCGVLHYTEPGFFAKLFGRG